jgi:anti-sigma factor RsiW
LKQLEVTMLCEQARQILADYMGDELGRDQRAIFEQHLAECESCSAEVASLQDAIRSLRTLQPAPATGMPLGNPAGRRSRMRAWQPLAYAATLLLGAGIGWWARPSAVQQQYGVMQEAPVVVQPGGSGRSQRELADDNFVRNALALSSAFTRGNVEDLRRAPR